MDVIRACELLLFDADEGKGITDEQWSQALFTDSDLIEGEINAAVNAAFAFVNRDYLKSDAASIHVNPKKSMSARKINTLRTALMCECAVLATYNHGESWMYGWSFFQTVQSLYREK
jgi:hypothetical protein